MKTATFHQTFNVFLQFLYRDALIHWKRIDTYVINNCLIWPVLQAICFAYLQPNVYFTENQIAMGVLIYTGELLIIMMVLSYTMNIALLFDIETTRFIDYQVTMLNPRLVLLEQILFTSLFVFVLLLPFFPITIFLLGPYFDSSHISWPALLLMLYLGSLCCSAYHMFVACTLKSSRQITRLWARYNLPLLLFGGLNIPWFTIKQYSPILGNVIGLNPLIYITDGLRQAVIGGPQFASLGTCVIALLLFSTAFTCGAWHFFKKRVDHI